MDALQKEGFTVFVERKIIQRMFGAPSQHLSYINGWKSLMDCVELFGHDHEFTTLDPKSALLFSSSLIARRTFLTVHQTNLSLLPQA